MWIDLVGTHRGPGLLGICPLGVNTHMGELPKSAARPEPQTEACSGAWLAQQRPGSATTELLNHLSAIRREAGMGQTQCSAWTWNWGSLGPLGAGGRAASHCY